MNVEAIFLILLITALLVALVIALAASDFSSNPCRETLKDKRVQPP